MSVIPGVSEVMDAIKMIIDILPDWLKFVLFLALIGGIGAIFSSIYGNINPSVCYEGQLYLENPQWKQISKMVTTGSPEAQILNWVSGIANAPVLEYRAITSAQQQKEAGFSADVGDDFYTCGLCINASSRLQDWPDGCTALNVVAWVTNPKCSKYLDVGSFVILKRFDYVETNKTWNNVTGKWTAVFMAGLTQEEIDAKTATYGEARRFLIQTYFIPNNETDAVIGPICNTNDEIRLGLLGFDLFDFNLWLLGIFMFCFVYSIKWMSQSGLFHKRR